MPFDIRATGRPVVCGVPLARIMDDGSLDVETLIYQSHLPEFIAWLQSHVGGIMTDTSSPRPWYAVHESVNNIDKGWVVLCGEPYPNYAITGWGSVTTTKANAELIAKAVNAYDSREELITEMARALKYISDHIYEYPATCHSEARLALKKAKAVMNHA